MYNIFHVVRDAVSGNLSFASKQDVASRRSLCDACEVQNKATKVCTACGCYIPWKTKLSKSSCPMELW